MPANVQHYNTLLTTGFGIGLEVGLEVVLVLFAVGLPVGLDVVLLFVVGLEVGYIDVCAMDMGMINDTVRRTFGYEKYVRKTRTPHIMSNINYLKRGGLTISVKGFGQGFIHDPLEDDEEEEEEDLLALDVVVLSDLDFPALFERERDEEESLEDDIQAGLGGDIHPSRRRRPPS